MLDVALGGDILCGAAALSISAAGLFFIFDFHLFPWLLRRSPRYQRISQRLLSAEAAAAGGGALGEGEGGGVDAGWGGGEDGSVKGSVSSQLTDGLLSESLNG